MRAKVLQNYSALKFLSGNRVARNMSGLVRYQTGCKQEVVLN